MIAPHHLSKLVSYRQKIDIIDADLVRLLAERFRCTDEVGLLKAELKLPAVDKNREDSQFARLKKLAGEADVDPDFIAALMRSIINEVVHRHKQIAINQKHSKASSS
ncbi:chorismate mutase [Ochrobactrum sp. MYb68]|nr:chorismate mutase [Ochrobactrum sp. MYb68]